MVALDQKTKLYGTHNIYDYDMFKGKSKSKGQGESTHSAASRMGKEIDQTEGGPGQCVNSLDSAMTVLNVE